MTTKATLQTPVEKLFMIGPTYGKRLKSLGIKTAKDLLYHFPFRYEDFSRIVLIREAREGEKVTVQGIVWEIQNEITKFKAKKITTATVNDGTGEVYVVWFNQPFLVKAIKIGDQISLSGKIEKWGRRLRMVSPEWEIISEKKENIHTGRLVPIYPETAKVSSKWLRSRIFPLLKSLISQEKEWLPSQIRLAEGLVDLKTALAQIHFPKNKESAEKARKRFAFEELFLLQLGALERRREWKRQKVKFKLEIRNWKLEIGNYISSLPFQLTDAQKRCIKEILEDLEKETPMNRLLEGDVGSGKTVVAAIAMYAVYLNKYRSALMAPTEILAHQHFQTLKRFLSPFGVKIALQTGSHKDLTKNKKQKTKNYDIIVGTHALLSESLKLEKLALIVIDEQHRFGVAQRAMLKHKAGVPHLLTMTATPIPRTVALTFYGDLDLSLLDEMPKGRKEVQTWVVSPKKRNSAYRWLEEKIRKEKSQAFIICPLIEESESLKSVRAATVEFKRLQKVFSHLSLGLLHGRMKSQEKNEVLQKFKEGKIDILVATPVVEVGIDVPNATIMVIEGAERFGLAQLHQLRGRVGRGEKKSYCLLFSESKSEKAYKRLKTLEKLHLGHKLAEIDLKLRGPGQIFGTAQHGFLNLKVASLDDLEMIQRARRAAKMIFQKDPSLKKFPPLKKKLETLKISQVEPD